MVLVYAVVPALILCLAVLYAVLARRFFTVKAKLPVLGVRGALGRTEGKRRGMAVLGTLFFEPAWRHSWPLVFGPLLC